MQIPFALTKAASLGAQRCQMPPCHRGNVRYVPTKAMHHLFVLLREKVRLLIPFLLDVTD